MPFLSHFQNRWNVTDSIGENKEAPFHCEALSSAAPGASFSPRSLLMPLFANAGLPLLMVLVPWAILGIVPVILVEAAWYWRFLRVPWAKAVWGSGAANLYSTTVGWFLAWGIMLVVQLVF